MRLSGQNTVPCLVLRALVAFLLLIVAARANDAQSNMAEFNQVLDEFIAEQRVFLNCSMLDSQLHKIAVGQFEDTVEATLDLLRTYGTPTDIAAFQAKTALAAIYMREHKFGEVIDMCAEAKDWMANLYDFKFIILQNEASRIFYHRAHGAERAR
jgi:hypothetical protein